MNLIEYLVKNIGESKTQAGIQLLNRPWNADLSLLTPYLPHNLSNYLALFQKEVRSRLKLSKNSTLKPYLGETNGLWLRVQAKGEGGKPVFLYGSEKLWVSQLWTQIIEDLQIEKIPVDSISPSDRAALISLYSVSHVCYGVLAGFFRVKVGQQRKIILERNSQAEQPHRLYWFAQYWTQQSYFSDTHNIINLLKEFEEAGQPLHRAMHANSSFLEARCNILIDKYLSLHPLYLHLIHEKDHPALASMFMRVKLIFYIYLKSLQCQIYEENKDISLRFDSMLSSKFYKHDLYRAGFSADAVEKLIAESRQKRVGDKFIVECGNDELTVGDLSLKYALQTYCDVELKAMNYRGDWFEKSYIANYIRDRVPQERYLVHRGIGNKDTDYDVDLIIEDSQTRLLYFCQIKHRIATLLPHFRDELSEYASPKGRISDGLQQIKNIRKNLADQDFIDRVRQAVGNNKLNAETLSKNARLMLIHNVENLDFCTSDGVVMYEWNTLRNLMKGEIMEVGNGQISSCSISSLSINLENPKQVMQELWMWADSKESTHSNQKPSFQWNKILSTQINLKIPRRIRVGALASIPFFSLNCRFPLF